MAALSGEKPLTELSAEFGVHPTMISNWKQELVKRAGERKVGDLLLRHEQLGHAADRCEGSGMHADPVGQRLGPARLGIGENPTRAPEGGSHLAGSLTSNGKRM
jgi:hypothetical protein